MQLDVRDAGLSIEAPDFVEVSLELWLHVPDIRAGISVRQRYLERTQALYLEPGRGEDLGRVAKQIGEFPHRRTDTHDAAWHSEQECYMWIGMPLRRPGGIRINSRNAPFEKAAGNPLQCTLAMDAPDFMYAEDRGC